MEAFGVEPGQRAIAFLSLPLLAKTLEQVQSQGITAMAGSTPDPHQGGPHPLWQGLQHARGLPTTKAQYNSRIKVFLKYCTTISTLLSTFWPTFSHQFISYAEGGVLPRGGVSSESVCDQWSYRSSISTKPVVHIKFSLKWLILSSILPNSRSNQFKTIDSKDLERLYNRLVVCSSVCSSVCLSRSPDEILQAPPDLPVQTSPVQTFLTPW